MRKNDAFVVYETDKNIAFLDYEPINEVHVLIVPKIHTDSSVNIPNDFLMDMNEIIRKMVCVYQKVYNAEGYSIMQNGGSCCDYGHFHMHVFSRFDNDGFGWIESEKPSDYSEKIAEKLRRASLRKDIDLWRAKVWNI